MPLFLSPCLQIKRMEMEARSFSADRSRALLIKVRDYKADLAALRTDLKKVRTGPELWIDVNFSTAEFSIFVVGNCTVNGIQLVRFINQAIILQTLASLAGQGSGFDPLCCPHDTLFGMAQLSSLAAPDWGSVQASAGLYQVMQRPALSHRR